MEPSAAFKQFKPWYRLGKKRKYVVSTDVETRGKRGSLVTLTVGLLVLEPAGRPETFFETVVGLERDGMMPERRPILQQLLQFSLIAPYYDNPLAAIPLGPQRVLFAVLGVAARFLGFRAWYEEYSPYGPVTLRKERSAQKEHDHVN